MIELLGVGVPRAGGRWPLHRVSARFRRGEIVLIVSRRAERDGLLDAVTGRRIPDEGLVRLSCSADRMTCSGNRRQVSAIGAPPARYYRRMSDR